MEQSLGKSFSDASLIAQKLNQSTNINLPSTRNDFTNELLFSLGQKQKFINPKFFYDETGSRLFEKITQLEEYYPTRTEKQILQDNAEEIAQIIGKNSLLIEPGAGSCEKVRLLLPALRSLIYMPQDISADFLGKTAYQIEQQYPWLEVLPLCGDFSHDISLPKYLPNIKRVIFYPGSTIGNFEPVMALSFMRRMRKLVGSNGELLIGVDLQKDPDVLHNAYNDRSGITAQFNKNILKHVNKIIKTDFDTDNFSHQAFYNNEESRIEMHLVSKSDHEVTCNDTTFSFKKGESIHTENSYKYTLDSFTTLAGKAGFQKHHHWTDKNGWFAVFCFK